MNTASKMYFCNEYMAVNSPNGTRLNTFPDFIVTADYETGRPISTAELKEGAEVYLLGSKWTNMLLGLGVRYRAPYKRLEDALGIEMIKYLDGLFIDYSNPRNYQGIPAAENQPAQSEGRISEKASAIPCGS